jgi:hypothetical protein
LVRPRRRALGTSTLRLIPGQRGLEHPRRDLPQPAPRGWHADRRPPLRRARGATLRTHIVNIQPGWPARNADRCCTYPRTGPPPAPGYACGEPCSSHSHPATPPPTTISNPDPDEQATGHTGRRASGQSRLNPITQDHPYQERFIREAGPRCPFTGENIGPGSGGGWGG